MFLLGIEIGLKDFFFHWIKIYLLIGLRDYKFLVGLTFFLLKLYEKIVFCLD